MRSSELSGWFVLKALKVGICSKARFQKKIQPGAKRRCGDFYLNPEGLTLQTVKFRFTFACENITPIVYLPMKWNATLKIKGLIQICG